MKKTLIVLCLFHGFVGLATSQETDSTELYPRFTGEGSKAMSVVGSLQYDSYQNGDNATNIAVGFSLLNFVADFFAVGGDLSVEYHSTAGSDGAVLLGLGPKFVGALRIPDAPVYPFAGAGYKFLGSLGSEGTSLHMLRFGFGLIIEVQKHWGIPLEFTIGLPLGEDSGSTIFNFTVGFISLGY